MRFTSVCVLFSDRYISVAPKMCMRFSYTFWTWMHSFLAGFRRKPAFRFGVMREMKDETYTHIRFLKFSKLMTFFGQKMIIPPSPWICHWSYVACYKVFYSTDWFQIWTEVGIRRKKDCCINFGFYLFHSFWEISKKW